MGLSNEERYEKVFYTLIELREHIDLYWRSPHELAYGQDKVVAKIVDSSRQLSGMILQMFDSSGTYWITGASNSGFRGYTSEYFSAKDAKDLEVDALMAKHYQEYEQPSLLRFAESCGFRDLRSLAKWWDLYDFVPALLYATNRYDDDAFTSDFKAELNRFLSHIADLKPETKYQEEKVLLLKYKFYCDDLDVGKIKVSDYTKKDELIKHYCDMTQQELQALIKSKREAEWKRDKEYSAEQNAKQAKKVNPVYGLVAEVEMKPAAAKKKKGK